MTALPQLPTEMFGEILGYLPTQPSARAVNRFFSQQPITQEQCYILPSMSEIKRWLLGQWMLANQLGLTAAINIPLIRNGGSITASIYKGTLRIKAGRETVKTTPDILTQELIGAEFDFRPLNVAPGSWLMLRDVFMARQSCVNGGINMQAYLRQLFVEKLVQRPDVFTMLIGLLTMSMFLTAETKQIIAALINQLYGVPNVFSYRLLTIRHLKGAITTPMVQAAIVGALAQVSGDIFISTLEFLQLRQSKDAAR